MTTDKKPTITITVPTGAASRAAMQGAYRANGLTKPAPTMVKEDDDTTYNNDHNLDLDDAIDTSGLIAPAPEDNPDNGAPVAPTARKPGELPPWAVNQFEVRISKAGNPYVAVIESYQKMVLDVLVPITWNEAKSCVTPEAIEKAAEGQRDYLTSLPDAIRIGMVYKMLSGYQEAFVYSTRQLDSLPESIARFLLENKPVEKLEFAQQNAEAQVVEMCAAIQALHIVYKTSVTGDGARPLSTSWYYGVQGQLEGSARQLKKTLTKFTPKTIDESRAKAAAMFSKRRAAAVAAAATKEVTAAA